MQRPSQVVDARNSAGTLQTAAERVDRLAEPAVVAEFPAVLQGGFDLLDALAVKCLGEDEHRDQGGASDEPGGPAGQGGGPPPPPLPPALDQAAVGDAAKRLLAQVSAQVIGQCGGIVITVGGPGGECISRRCPPARR